MTTKVKLTPSTNPLKIPLPIGTFRQLPNTNYLLEYEDSGLTVSDGNYLLSQSNGYEARINIYQRSVKFIRGRASEIDTNIDLFLDE